MKQQMNLKLYLLCQLNISLLLGCNIIAECCDGKKKQEKPEITYRDLHKAKQTVIITWGAMITASTLYVIWFDFVVLETVKRSFTISTLRTMWINSLLIGKCPDKLKYLISICLISIWPQSDGDECRSQLLFRNQGSCTFLKFTCQDLCWF